MTDLMSEMTRDELREMLETLIEQKLIEMLGDPDEGLELREEIRERLLRQKKGVASGKRGEGLEDVAKRLDLS